ncbi:hypothetical protein B0J14DRAFT_581827 [Halenospora varia]|nr:hypothetical protein B0J14DRAFT_581827 [Halenospora varia]
MQRGTACPHCLYSFKLWLTVIIAGLSSSSLIAPTPHRLNTPPSITTLSTTLVMTLVCYLLS